MITRHYKNISNRFSTVEDVGRALDWIMDANTEAVFGVETELEGGRMSLTLITPPYIRLGEDSPVVRLLDCEGDLTCYEGYLVEPHFLPLYGALDGLLIEGLEDVQLEGDEAVALQFLLRRRTDNWKKRAVEMYSSFLEGNDYPFYSRIGRKFQDGVLNMINRWSSIDTSRTYIQEVERKLMQEGYQFQLRVLVRSAHPDRVRYRLEELFKKYDGHNALRLYRVKAKRCIDLYREVVLTYNTHTQILSREEVASLFGGRKTEVVQLPLVAHKTAPEGNTELSEPNKQVGAFGLVSLLPYYPRETVEMDDSIVTRIAEALKTVGVISSARLYNHSVTSGVRLTVVQFDIPNGKTLTQLSSKVVDIQAELGVQSLGIEQGSKAGTVKFTIPNEESAIISLRELMELESFQEFARSHPLAFIVGVDEINNPIYLSLAKLVHLLVAGTTGSGKSVFINALVTCLLANYTPDELRLYMIDPKQVEMQHYEGFPHVEEVITDMSDAAMTLSSVADEMEKRYTLFREAGVKNIQLYNKKMSKKMPYIVCVIDEYADLKDTHPEVEDFIARLGQKARAAGIHMVLATQRPEAKIVSGRVKAVIPNAISFNLNSNLNYKTVFGKGLGGVTLLGQGDGVMKIEGYKKEFQRFQGCIISPNEAEEEKVFEKMKEYLLSVNHTLAINAEEFTESNKDKDEDAQLKKLKEIITETGETKVDFLRSKLSIKASTLTKLMGQLVEEGFLIKHKSKAKGYEIANK